jgi:energy-coupling factor transporter ATP-binding protein EcfA2
VAIENLLVGRTVMVIAHRMATIRRAHRIAVVHEGSIVQVRSCVCWPVRPHCVSVCANWSRAGNCCRCCVCEAGVVFAISVMQ